MKASSLLKVLFATVILGIAGCSHMPSASFVIKPSKAEVELAELAKKQDAELKALSLKIATYEKEFKVAFDANISLGSASVMAVYDTMVADPVKDKFDIAEMMGLEVAMKSLPEPTVADYRITTETQRKLLSEQAIELEAGKAEIARQKGIADANKAAQEEALRQKEALETEKKAQEDAFAIKKAELEKKAIDEKNEALVKAAQREQEAKDQSRKDLQILIVKILMGFAVVAGIIAVVTKSWEAGVACAVSVALAIGVSFLPLIVVGGGVVIVLGLVGYGLYRKYRNADSALANVVGATQQYKEKNPEAFKENFAPHLIEWNGTDSSESKTIEQKLKELNLK